MKKIGCNVSSAFGNLITENMTVIKKLGFDTTFFEWNEEMNLEEIMLHSLSIGLFVEALHAPFYGADCIWQNENDGDIYTEKLRMCIIQAAKYKIPYVVLRATNSVDVPKTSHIGLVRYGKLIKEAEKQNVKLCFENCEYVRHLALVLDSFKSENVGFCYNLGREECFTPGIKYLSLFADRLFLIHINDNNGFPANKTLDPCSDLQRIPFDGSLDMVGKLEDLKKCGYDGSLLFEIGGCKTDDFYNDCTAEEFYGKAYSRAVEIRHIFCGQ